MDPRNNQVGELNKFIYTRCYDQLCADVSVALGRPLSAILHRQQYAITVDEESVTYSFFAWVEYIPDEEVEAFQITCKITFDEKAYQFSLVDVQREDGEWPEHDGVRVDQNLIPRLHADDMREAEAERFLARYCPTALTTPMSVPIHSIMERMGLTVVNNIQLLGGANALTMFGDEDELVTDAEGDIMILPCRRGTVLIDSETIFKNGVGSMNFALAHEAYHWYDHRAYVDFHRIVGAQGDGSYNGTSRFNSSDILEIQANAIAARILMPKGPFAAKYRELAGDDIHETISELAAFFHVSYTAATIRLSQLGLTDFKTKTRTTNVSFAEASELYFSDPDFRNLIEEEKVVYVSGHYVYNDPKYVQLVWEDVPRYDAPQGPYRLTEYAITHPEEAYVSFIIDHQRVAAHEDYILESRSDAHLRAKIDTTRIKFPSETSKMIKHARNFERKFAQIVQKTYCDILKQMLIYRYGRMEDFDPDKERNWDPAVEMPETHERYFSDISDNEELEQDIAYRFQDNLVPNIRDKAGRIIEAASSPIDLFYADTYQPRQYYEKVMKGTAGQPDSATLMSLCVGLCLSMSAATILFRSAGRALSWERTDMAYRYVLRHLRGDFIEDVNVFLDELGIPPLGAKKNIPT